MKNHLRRIRAILNHFGVDAFYCITIYQGHISFQGNFSSGKVALARKLKFIEQIADSGYVELDRGVYNITLT
jgi:hypothetical protein